MVAEYELLLEQSSELGASEDQIAVVELALAEGRTVTFEEYKTAKEAEIQCVEALGTSIVRLPEERRAGWVKISYMYGGTTDSAEQDALSPLAEECAQTHGRMVEIAYRFNETVALRDQVFADYRGAMLSCLEERGAIADEDASTQDILVLDLETSIDKYDQTCREVTGLAAVL